MQSICGCQRPDLCVSGRGHVFSIYLRMNKEMIYQFTSCAPHCLLLPTSSPLPPAVERINQLSDTCTEADREADGGGGGWA